MSGFDLIAEERIREAMRSGVFDNLPGVGKPLELGDDEWIPSELRVAYRILKNAGCVPPEIDACREATTLRKLIAGTIGEAARRRAIVKLALIEANFEARGLKLAAAPDYFSLIAGSPTARRRHAGIGRLSLK